MVDVELILSLLREEGPSSCWDKCVQSPTRNGTTILDEPVLVAAYAVTSILTLLETAGSAETDQPTRNQRCPVMAARRRTS